MIVKTAVLLFIFEALTLATSLPLLNVEQSQNGAAQVLPIPVNVVLDQVENGGDRIVQQVADRLGNAFVTTYDQQRTSVDNTLNTIENMGKKTVESGVRIVKNGLELFFIVPTFGRNIISQPRS